MMAYGVLGWIWALTAAVVSSLIQPAGGSRRPASHETIEEHGHYIHMDGKEVYKFATRIMARRR
jgi:3-oxoacyl-[acyl-carrier-protein] synthase-3